MSEMPPTKVLSGWADLDWDEYVSRLRLPMFVVYRHPIDHPDKIAVRLWDIDRLLPRPTPYVVLLDKAEDAISSVQEPWRHNFMRLERQPEDEPHIVCVYV